jgi:hypothetical protein
MGSMKSSMTPDSIAQPPKNLIFCMMTPIAYAGVVAPFRSECDVYAKPSRGSGTGSGSYGSANPRDYSGSDSVSWVRTLESQVITGSGP